jgi:hypothetical protein
MTTSPLVGWSDGGVDAPAPYGGAVLRQHFVDLVRLEDSNPILR